MISKRTITAMNRDFTERVSKDTVELEEALAKLVWLTEADTFHAQVDGTMYRIAPVDDSV